MTGRRPSGVAGLKTLYISYFGALKHLSQTQVVPYLKGLARRGIGVTFVSFEERWPDGRAEKAARDSLRDELARAGVTWVPLRYHKRPSLPATFWDALVASVVSAYLVLRHSIRIVHARNHVPAVTGLLLQLAFRRKLIFDLRGTMAEEYVDAGLWRPRGTAYRATKIVERLALRRADAVVMLTNRVRDRLVRDDRHLQRRQDKIQIIPCCVDLSHHPFPPKPGARAGLGFEGARVMVYVGSLGGWYLTDAMARLFRIGRWIEPRLRFLVLTQSPALAEAALQREGLSSDSFRIMTVSPSEVPRHLAACDFGVCFLKPCLSKESSSPTKIGEYLASGLPILANRGVGDIDSLIGRGRLGVLIGNHDDTTYASALREMLDLLEYDGEIRSRCRRAAIEEFDLSDVGIARYLSVYERLGPGFPASTEREA